MKKKKGLNIKLLILTLLPAFLVGIIAFLISVSRMRSGMVELSQSRVENICNALREAYTAMYPGDWSYDGTNFTKGGQNLYDTYAMLDKISEEDNIEITIFYGDTRIMTTVLGDNGERFVNTQAGEAAINKTLRGGEGYFSPDTIINDEKYYSCYTPLTNSDGSIIGMFFVGVPSKSVNVAINGASNFVLGAIAGVLIGTCVVVMLIALNLIKTIQSCVNSVVTMESGDLNVKAEAGFFDKGDELGLLVDSINGMADRFKSMIGQIRNSSDVMKGNADTLAGVAESTHSSIDEVSRAIEDVANGATSQASDTQDAAINIEAMSTSIESIVDGINDLAAAADSAQNTSEGAKKAMHDLIRINEETKASVEKIVGQSEINVNAAARIQEVVNVISDIASQTNLLSLNASIEAARAGEQGKGFSVVALEVGKLADSSSKSAAEIEEIIKELVQNIEETFDLTTLLSQNTRHQIDKLESTRKDFDGVVRNVNVMFDKTMVVQDEISKINDIRRKIEEIIENLSALSEENAASSQETTASTSMVVQSMQQLNASTQEISALAAELARIISYFRA